MEQLTESQIRADNPHFGPVIRQIEEIQTYNSKTFDFTHTQTVGAKNSVMPGYGIEPDIIVDSWATYLWSPSKNIWVLGAN